jgi:DNA repair exonuclease SbcCD ATPase subunit
VQRRKYAACSPLQQRSRQQQQSLEAALAERQARIAALEAALARQQAALDHQSAQLRAYQGLTPKAAAQLQQENASLAAAKRAAEAAAADAAARAEAAGRQVADGVSTWQRLQAELQAENGRMAVALQRQQGEAAALFQEKEVLRAKAGMLEARAAALAPPALLPLAPVQPQAQGGLPDAAGAAKLAAEAVQLRERLAAAQQRAEERDAASAARKYKVRVGLLCTTSSNGCLAALMTEEPVA